jgi:hypothetical protein
MIIEHNHPISIETFKEVIANAGPRYRLVATPPSFGVVAKARLKKFAPLIIAFGTVCAITAIRPILFGFDLSRTLRDFMAAFFLIFGSLKVLNWKKFAEMFRAYDPLAARSRFYAYLYPALEIGLGLAYAFYLSPEIVFNVVTILILGASTIGIIKALRKGKELNCACLGGYFNIPISSFTIFENILMILMAIVMQIFFGKI